MSPCKRQLPREAKPCEKESKWYAALFSFFRQEQASGRRARAKSPGTAKNRGHKSAVSHKVKARQAPSRDIIVLCLLPFKNKLEVGESKQKAPTPPKNADTNLPYLAK